MQPRMVQRAVQRGLAEQRRTPRIQRLIDIAIPRAIERLGMRESRPFVRSFPTRDRRYWGPGPWIITSAEVDDRIIRGHPDRLIVFSHIEKPHAFAIEQIGDQMIYGMTSLDDHRSLLMVIGGFYAHAYWWSAVVTLEEESLRLVGMIDARILDPAWNVAALEIHRGDVAVTLPNTAPIIVPKHGNRLYSERFWVRERQPAASHDQLTTICVRINDAGAFEVVEIAGGEYPVWVPGDGRPVPIPESVSLEDFIKEYFAYGLDDRGVVHGDVELE